LQKSISATDVRDDYISDLQLHIESTAIFIAVYLFIARHCD